MSGVSLSDDGLAELEAKARYAKRRADVVMDSAEYKVSYALVSDDLAFLGEAVPDLADATLALIAEVRLLRAAVADFDAEARSVHLALIDAGIPCGTQDAAMGLHWGTAMRVDRLRRERDEARTALQKQHADAAERAGRPER